VQKDAIENNEKTYNLKISASPKYEDETERELLL
jgi:hypothetical protein